MGHHHSNKTHVVVSELRRRLNSIERTRDDCAAMAEQLVERIEHLSQEVNLLLAWLNTLGAREESGPRFEAMVDYFEMRRAGMSEHDALLSAAHKSGYSVRHMRRLAALVDKYSPNAQPDLLSPVSVN